MPQDPSNPKHINPNSILAAIQSLQQKGWDINPYTIAEEVQILPSVIYQDTQLMNLISEVTEKNSLTKEQMAEVSFLQNKIQELSMENHALQEKIESLKNENSINEPISESDDFPSEREAEAWQQGYYAAIEDMHKQSLQNASSTVSYLEEFEDKESVSQDNTAESIDENNNNIQLQSQTLSEDDLHNLLQYRFKYSREEITSAPINDEGLSKLATSKFVGQGKSNQQELPPPQYIIRNVPSDIRRSCLLLGLRPEALSREDVHKAWRTELSKAHPDTGGDNEIAVYLNHARDMLYRWLDSQAPKLGKKFGASARQFRHTDTNHKEERR